MGLRFGFVWPLLAAVRRREGEAGGQGLAAHGGLGAAAEVQISRRHAAGAGRDPAAAECLLNFEESQLTQRENGDRTE
jgi:hypothetical protein